MAPRPAKRMRLLLPTALGVVLSTVAVARQPPGRTTAPKPVPTKPSSRLVAPRPLRGNTPAVGVEAPKPALTNPIPQVGEEPVNVVLDQPDEAGVKPLPLMPIPDNPPPHEGAMISIPCIIEPPSVIRIEVLQALPGRPIVGERLVRPDGTVSLDFYGDVQVRGLTVLQAKEKVVLHLRRYMSDDLLGLYKATQDLMPMRDEAGKVITIQPADSDTVFVDIQSYNSDVYYVQGDVGIPGRFPWTGNETVLDAFIYAGGFVPTADEFAIHLVRPARGGKPAKVFPVDLAAIRDRGEVEKNYQIFPGDRLVVGRNPVVKATVELDRLSNASRIVINDIMTFALMTKTLTFATSGTPLTAAQREAFLKGWLDTSVKRALEPGGAKLDEKGLREIILRHLEDPTVAPVATPPK